MATIILPTREDAVTGESVFNEAALFVRPHWLCTDPDIAAFAAAAVVGARSAALPMEVSYEAPFMGHKFLVWHTANQGVLITLYDKASKHWIARDPIHIDSIAGFAGEPFFLLDPLWVEQGSEVIARYTLLFAGAQQIKFYAEGARYFHKDANVQSLTKFVDQKREEHLHNYLTFLTTTDTPVVLGAGATVTYWLEIKENYWFTVKKITAVQATGAAAGAFAIQMFDHRGTPLSFAGTDSRATMGIGSDPEVLRQPWTIPPNRRIRIVLTDLTGGANTFYLTFTGAAHYV